MSPATQISRALETAKSEGRPGMVAFMTAGYPKPEGFVENLRAVCAESDVVEIGVPFTDPMADGMTVQRASHAAIASGVSLAWIFEQLAGFDNDTPLVLMSYLNPLLAFGLRNLAGRAVECGVNGFIVPDLPYEESEDIRSALDDTGLALVQLVTPVTPLARVRALWEASRGFVYAVTTTGITGGAKGLPEEVVTYLDQVRAASALPVCAGFGIRTADQVAWLTGHADGVVVGSALVEVLERNDDPAAFLRGLRGVN